MGPGRVCSSEDTHVEPPARGHAGESLGQPGPMLAQASLSFVHWRPGKQENGGTWNVTGCAVDKAHSRPGKALTPQQ